MSNPRDSSANLPDDMVEYLQTFLDETEEQLDDLTETLLSLESVPSEQKDLNEAFRLIHSIKGSAGMMGFQSITELAHELENRFEKIRSGEDALDEATMNLVLRSVDFLRQCNKHLRAGESVGDSSVLLTELQQLKAAKPTAGSPPTDANVVASSDRKAIQVIARFRDGLQLADLKAQLILRRIRNLGVLISTSPTVDQLSSVERLVEFEMHITTNADQESIRAAINVEGVDSVEFCGIDVDAQTDAEVEQTEDAVSRAVLSPLNAPNLISAPLESEALLADGSFEASSPSDAQSTARVGQSMRVDIDRLDNLMNLAGELVVNRARFVQVSGRISPALRKASSLNRIREFSENLRRTVESLQSGAAEHDYATEVLHLQAGMELMAEQIETLENSRHCLGQISEAVDQLSRISDKLQRVVLDTRMIPIGPLFNRFKRVVRDLSKEYGKRVELKISGEKTELDKRMIDDLFDPLMHLVRNSMDHGLETAETRSKHGKSEVGTIYLEASHSGNNVIVHVRDDGKGIDVEKIKSKLIDKGLLEESAVGDLSDEEALTYIWRPGFSTSATVTDVSGRGVGMDVVKTKIARLSGTVDVDSSLRQGTQFTIRLPLTLAIINSLLVRLRRTTFSMPMNNIREIVVVKNGDIVHVAGKQAFEIRGEFVPLIRIEDAFHWNKINHGHEHTPPIDRFLGDKSQAQVVILQSGERTVGLEVDELLGNQDIVVKSLSDNYVDIRGLSGASILGDGGVCLMLDVSMLIDMAVNGASRNELENPSP